VNCELSGTTLHGYVDGELDAVRAAEFEGHVQTCADCKAALERTKILQAAFRRANLYEHAPAGLSRRVRTQLSLGDAEKTTPAWRSWFLVPAFSLAAVVAVFSVAMWLVQSHTRSAQITAELIDAHIRSLQAGHTMDVPSTDQHTVKPWFDGKVDFIPPVADYSAQGFTLIGGRLDFIDGHNAAVLVYARAKHTVNVFVWPSRLGHSVPDSSGSREGYNWILWHAGDMTLCAISDTAPASLRQLKDYIHP
jgi:anti-sigma factor RsiW